MPKLAVGLVYCAMLTIYDHEKNIINQHWSQITKGPNGETVVPEDYPGPGILGNFILLLISHLYDMKAYSLNIPHYF